MTTAQLFFASTLVLVLACLLNASITLISLRRLKRAITTFADSGGRDPIQLPWNVPGEIRSLAAAFARLVGKVSIAVKRDEEVSRLKSEFITVAAHQLQTPMAAIRWAVEGLEATPLTPEQQPLVEAINTKGADLENIINTFIRVSEVEIDPKNFTIVPLDLVGLTSEVIASYQTLITSAQVSVTAQFPPAFPLVPADRERIRQILTTLVENAIRYTPTGGTIRIMGELGPRIVLVRVRDTGIGVLESDRGKIFEPFYRGSNAVTHDTEGNGLELFIARTIARAHGGDLTFTSNTPAAGTTFSFSLPTAI